MSTLAPGEMCHTNTWGQFQIADLTNSELQPELRIVKLWNVQFRVLGFRTRVQTLGHNYPSLARGSKKPYPMNPDKVIHHGNKQKKKPKNFSSLEMEDLIAEKRLFSICVF